MNCTYSATFLCVRLKYNFHGSSRECKPQTFNTFIKLVMDSITVVEVDQRGFLPQTKLINTLDERRNYSVSGNDQ